jgi:tetratricopeptide (TPR) repeat protein
MDLRYLVKYFLLSVVMVMASSSMAQESSAGKEPQPSPQVVAEVSQQTADETETEEEKEDKSPASSSLSLYKQLRKGGITAISAEEETETRRELQDLIAELGSLTLPKIEKAVSRQGPIAEPLEEIEEAEPAPVTKAQPQPEPQKPLADHLLIALEKNPQSVVDPFGVAEALFASGDLDKAAKFYQLAIDRMASQEQHPDGDWAMLQKANCLREEAPDIAEEIYQKFDDQYPNSVWNTTGRAHQQVISWYKKNDPHTVISQCIIEEEQESIIISEPNSL